MTYKVLARKCRPQTFDEVIGQKHVTRTLSNAIRDGRVAHAFLFTGERGVGKTSVARILAKALNCHSGPTAQPCGTCASCLEITGGGALDVHEIDGASNTGVDDIRVLRENVRYMPSRDRFKIYIIDEVHMLSTSAFNALLKTLEEPPAHVIFVFATTEPQKIPDTIISRCLRFDFKRIPLKEIIDHLEQIARSEHISISRHGFYLISREAEGSMRDAQTILERAISYCGSEVKDADLQEMLGHIDRQLIYRIMGAVLDGDPKECIDGLTAAYEFGVDLKKLYYSLLEHVRDLMMVKSIKDCSRLIEAADEDVKKLEEFAGRTSQDELLRLFRLCFSAETDIVRSAFPKVALEVCLLEMLHAKRTIPADEILTRIESLQKHIGQPGVSAYAVPASPRPPAQAREEHRAAEKKPLEKASPQGAAGAGAGDEGLAAFLRKKHPPLSSYLAQARIEAGSDDTVKFEFPAGDFFLEKVRDPDTEAKLRELCSEFFQKPVRILIVASQEKRGAGERNEKEQSKESRRQQALHNPVVQKVVEAFNGKIVDIRTDT